MTDIGAADRATLHAIAAAARDAPPAHAAYRSRINGKAVVLDSMTNTVITGAWLDIDGGQQLIDVCAVDGRDVHVAFSRRSSRHP